MYRDFSIAVIIPVLNEADSIGPVLDAIPAWVDRVIVADNGSTDGTGAVAAARGATVVEVPERGYGAACLGGIAALDAPDIVVFLDGDYSDHPEEMDRLLDPIVDDRAELVIGSRVLGEREAGALTPQAAFGNWLATRLMRFFWGVSYSDLGPFRAVRIDTLTRLGMRDRDYGWTVEMQIKGALHGVRSTEVPVSYRKRIGVSKVSGTVRGVLGAGYKILGWIFACVLFSDPATTDTVIAIFTRWPEAGKTKTRMIPALGAEGAAELQRAMTEHVVDCAPGRMDVELRFAGGDTKRMRRWLGPIYRYTPQGPGDLGERMGRAFEENVRRGYDKILVVGADCPEIDATVSQRASDALRDHDLVLGPAHDGGYYLIGLRANAVQSKMTALFRGVAWGGAEVLAQTIANAEALGLRYALLESLHDVDRPEDLPVWERAQAAQRLAIVVPALNESERISATLSRIQPAKNTEIIVADGGSTDDTVTLAEAAGARVVHAPRGRARQMNAGAWASDAPLLLFVHADTVLPPDFAGQVRRGLASEEVALGAFRLAIDGRGTGYRWLEWAANLRSTWGQMPYGDQALFVRRSLFASVGGYPEQPALEDYDLVRTLARRGRIHIAPAAALTSARRWRVQGASRTTVFNVFVFLTARWGLARSWVARRDR